MRYALPVTASDELEPLFQAGADEFYCGYQDRAWESRYGTHDSLTRRQGAANIEEAGELQRVLRTAKRLRTPVWLAVNGRYTSEQWDSVLLVCDLWSREGGDGLIVRDPVLLQRLSALPAYPRLAVSLLAVCLNRKAVEFWVGLGADRIVLPRSVPIREMEQLTRAFPDCEFEAMVMADRCLFVDGLCRCIHGSTYPERSEAAESPEVIRSFDVSGQAHHLCLDCYDAVGDGCAACRLESLTQAGIAVGKFGGRGTPLEYRLRLLSFLRQAAAEPDAAKRAALHRHILGECRCYYGEGEA